VAIKSVRHFQPDTLSGILMRPSSKVRTFGKGYFQTRLGELTELPRPCSCT